MWQIIFMIFLNGEVKMEIPKDKPLFETQEQCQQYRDENIERWYHKFKRSKGALIFDGMNAYCDRVHK